MGSTSSNNHGVLEEIKHAQGELDMFKKNPERNSSVYFVMKKRDVEIINR